MGFPIRKSFPSILEALCVVVASFMSCLDQYPKKTLNSLNNNIASLALYSFSSFFLLVYRSAIPSYLNLDEMPLNSTNVY